MHSVTVYICRFRLTNSLEIQVGVIYHLSNPRVIQPYPFKQHQFLSLHSSFTMQNGSSFIMQHTIVYLSYSPVDRCKKIQGKVSRGCGLLPVYRKRRPLPGKVFKRMKVYLKMPPSHDMDRRFLNLHYNFQSICAHTIPGHIGLH